MIRRKRLTDEIKDISQALRRSRLTVPAKEALEIFCEANFTPENMEIMKN